MDKRVRTPRDRITYYIFRPIVKIFVFIFYNVKCIGKENVPKSGSFILAANHISLTDPVILVAVSPRTCHFMAKSELFRNPLFGALLRSMNAFPVQRGKSDSRSLTYAETVIEKGFVLGIFPEGKRQKDRLPIKPKSGVAYIAKQTGVDILPVSIYHTPGEKRFRPKITIRFGEMIKNEEMGFSAENKNQEVRNAARLIMNRIVENWEKKHDGRSKNEN